MDLKILSKDYRFWIFSSFVVLCLFPFISSAIALILGFTLASIGLIPNEINLNSITKKMLSWSIVGLGFGIHLNSAIEISKNSFPLVVGSIFSTLVLAIIITKLLKIEKNTGFLIGSGTAICGGSAIAAVAPAINAKNEQMAVALACVFILNSVALFIFPLVGHLLHLTEYQFGLWCAVAIHDTSSVVGAASAYGDQSLLIATTVKLARALWIVPVALISAVIFGGNKKIAIPHFIIYYCVAILIAYFLPQGAPVYEVIFTIAKRSLVVCLFLIGAGITIKKMKATGPKPMLLALLLWVIIGSCSLWYITHIQ